MITIRGAVRQGIYLQNCFCYPNGTESKASNEITSTLVSGVPVIQNVSVKNTDAVMDLFFISWKETTKTRPLFLLKSYEYLIYRATGVGGTDFQAD